MVYILRKAANTLCSRSDPFFNATLGCSYSTVYSSNRLSCIFCFCRCERWTFFLKFLHPNFRCPCKLINLGHTDETNWFPIRIKRRSRFSSYIDGANIFLNGCYLTENLANLNCVSHLYYPALNPLFPWDCLLNWHETWKIEYWLITMQVAGN